LIYKSLMKFLEKMQIPVVATLRDSQAYIRSAESGCGVFEMKPTAVREDLEQWLPLIGWLAQRKPLHVEPGTPAITSAPTTAPKVATVTLESIAPSAPVAKPSALQPVAAPMPVMAKPATESTPPRLNPDAVVNALASPASALSNRAASSGKIERSGSLLPALLRRVFG
jgi:hypothetical protein